MPKESAVVGRQQSGTPFTCLTCTQFTCFTSTQCTCFTNTNGSPYLEGAAAPPYLRSELTHAIGLAKSIENDAASSEAVGKQLQAIYAVKRFVSSCNTNRFTASRVYNTRGEAVREQLQHAPFHVYTIHAVQRFVEQLQAKLV